MRLLGEQKDIKALQSIALMRSPLNDPLVTLGAIADVGIALEAQNEIALVNGKTTMLGYLRKTPSSNAVEIADKPITAEEAQRNLPNGTRIHHGIRRNLYQRNDSKSLERCSAVSWCRLLSSSSCRLTPTIIIAPINPTHDRYISGRLWYGFQDQFSHANCDVFGRWDGSRQRSRCLENIHSSMKAFPRPMKSL